MRTFIATLVFISFFIPSFSQCPTCTPDETCISADGLPTVCPLELPAATAGEYYEQVLTFYLPTSFVEPELDVTVTLTQITITSVTGLPFGITYTTNDPDGIYYPNQGENFGCATICGTPLLPGVYDVIINVGIIADVFGFEVTDSRTFTYSLFVQPGSGGNASFTFNNGAGCGEVGVQFEALIAGTASQVTEYSWDFGNGTTSNEANPFVNYSGEGEYTASLTTTISDIILTTVSLANINDNGEGDVDEFFSGPADPYFVVTDAQGTTVYTSSIIDNSTSNTWADLTIVLSNPPYTLTFWDDDTVTQDDQLGSFTVDTSTGEISFNSGDGTVGTYTVVLNPSTNATESSVITVFPTPSPVITQAGSSLTASGNVDDEYLWFLNGSITPIATTQTINATAGGVYTCQVTNIYGCTATSESFIICPEVNPIFDPAANEVYVEDIFETYQWYFNGLPIDGATTFFVVEAQPGNYAVEVTTSYGCSIESEVLTVINSVDENEWSKLVSIYPNPAKESFTLSIEGNDFVWEKLAVYSSTGQRIVDVQNPSHLTSLTINTAALAAGSYILQLSNSDQLVTKKLTIIK